MLVCARKVGESLLIGDEIVVTLVRIGPNSCRIGVKAPKEFNIVRDELVASHPIQESNDGLRDLGQRVIDPLDVADAYTEQAMIDHG